MCATSYAATLPGIFRCQGRTYLAYTSRVAALDAIADAMPGHLHVDVSHEAAVTRKSLTSGQVSKQYPAQHLQTSRPPPPMLAAHGEAACQYADRCLVEAERLIQRIISFQRQPRDRNINYVRPHRRLWQLHHADRAAMTDSDCLSSALPTRHGPNIPQSLASCQGSPAFGYALQGWSQAQGSEAVKM